MPFRFRRTVRLLPGVRLNVSKSGLSTSFGGRGGRVTLGHGKTRTTVGLPGTGLSYTATSSTRSGKGAPRMTWWARLLLAIAILLILKLLGWL